MLTAESDGAILPTGYSHCVRFVPQTETIFRSIWPQIFRRADAGVAINIAQDLARNAWT